MKYYFKKIIKFIAKLFLSIGVIRRIVRRSISSAKFLDGELRYKLRGITESLSPEEILEVKSETLNCKFYYPNRSIVGLRVAEFGYWDEFSVLFDIFLRKAKTIVEVGANIGADTIFLAKKALPDCKILAFEPCDKYRRILEKNIKENALNNISVYNYFLSSKSNEKIELYLTSSSASIIKDCSKFFPSIDKQISLSLTLDDFCLKMIRLNYLDFLKVDTDGWDKKVMEGGRKTIKKFKPFLMVEFSGYLLERAGDSNASFVEFLYSLGYNDFFLFREKTEPPLRIEGHKNLLRFLVRESSSDVFAIPPKKI